MHKPTTFSIVLAFAIVYLFWGSTYTAIHIGTAVMPALLFAGVRYILSGGLLLGWCGLRGMRLWWPNRQMLVMATVGLMLLAGCNVALIYAEKTLPSGLASLVLAVTPLFIAVLEMALPGGEPMSVRGWAGLLLGFVGMAVLLQPSLRSGLHGNATLLLALIVLIAGAFSWAAGSVLARRMKLSAPTLVTAAWQMFFAGAFCLGVGSLCGEWPEFHVTRPGIYSLTYLVTCGSLLGYTGFVYLIEHVPVAKVSSYCYVNPCVAVLLGMLFLGERPEPAEFAGMALILVAVFLMTTARVSAPARAATVKRA